MTLPALLILASFSAYYVVAIRKTGLLTADSLFVYLQATVRAGW